MDEQDQKNAIVLANAATMVAMVLDEISGDDMATTIGGNAASIIYTSELAAAEIAAQLTCQ